ncbi:MAG: EthD family reductase [Rhodobacteraceae bacterium]|nr:EthD family reductase [Paracoccaceae bacterium]
MTISLQVLYPTENDTTFDHDYYASKHMPIVGEHMGQHIATTQIIKGLAGGPDTPPGFHTIATMTFVDQAALDSALATSGPVLADIPNFFSGQPQMLIGEVKG